MSQNPQFPHNQGGDPNQGYGYGPPTLKACEATEYKEAHILSTLAAAYAESGDFEKAREWATKAVETGKQEGHEQLEQLEQLEKELEAYKADKPWREEQKTEENAKPFAVVDAIET